MGVRRGGKGFGDPHRFSRIPAFLHSSTRTHSDTLSVHGLGRSIMRGVPTGDKVPPGFGSNENSGRLLPRPPRGTAPSRRSGCRNKGLSGLHPFASTLQNPNYRSNVICHKTLKNSSTLGPQPAFHEKEPRFRFSPLECNLCAWEIFCVLGAEKEGLRSKTCWPQKNENVRIADRTLQGIKNN